MKKIRALFLFPLLLGAVTATASCSKSGKIQLTFGEVTHQQTRDILYRDLTQMNNNKESFLLVVYPDGGCGCYNEFMRASENYIKEHHLVLYRIFMSQFDNQDNLGIKLATGNTSFAIFENGSLVQSITSNESDVMRKKEDFAKYMDDRIIAPKMYFVTERNLELIYHSAEKAVVLFERLSCGDCTYVLKNFLIDYMKGQNDIIYVFDGDSVRGKGTPEELDDWRVFKNYWGISNVNNPEYGYDGGVVPTFFLVNGSPEQTNFISGAVTFNDELSVDSSGKVKVTNTYYSSERLSSLQYAGQLMPIEGLEINSLDYIEYEGHYYWDQSAAMKYHQPYLKAFLDYALPQVTSNLIK